MIHSWKTKAIVQNIGLLLSSLLICLVAGEFIVRVYERAPIWPLVPSKPRWSNELFRPSETRGWELTPCYDGNDFSGVHVKLNSLGFRDSEHAFEKPNKSFRTLSLEIPLRMVLELKRKRYILSD